MYSPLSSKFIRSIKESGKRKTVVDILYNGIVVATDLPVSDGYVRYDLEGDLRASGSITIADSDLIPTLSTTLSPLGAEVQVRQGVVYPDGSEELIPLGVFRLEVTDWEEIAAVPAVAIYDRSRGLSATEIRGFISRAGWVASAVIIEFLEWYYPNLAPINAAALFAPGIVDYRLPGGHLFDEGSFWAAISDLARNMGGRLYFDREGQPKVTPIESLATTSVPVAEIAVGTEGTLERAGHSYSREGVYNGIAVVGAAREDGTFANASVFNLDPSSPLLYGGPFGRAVDVINDSSLTTDPQCYSRALTELAKHTGLAYTLDFTAVANPALDVGDFVEFVYDDRSEVHVLSTLSVPLGRSKYTGTSKGLMLNA